jgi:hypothetical protein
VLSEGLGGALRERPDRNEVAVTKSANLRFPHSHKCLRPTGGRDELDLICVRSEDLDYGTNIPGLQADGWEVTSQCDGIQQIEHDFTLGRP